MLIDHLVSASGFVVLVSMTLPAGRRDIACSSVDKGTVDVCCIFWKYAWDFGIIDARRFFCVIDERSISERDRRRPGLFNSRKVRCGLTELTSLSMLYSLVQIIRVRHSKSSMYPRHNIDLLAARGEYSTILLSHSIGQSNLVGFLRDQDSCAQQ